MTHKVHPKAIRLRQMSDWLGRGFYGKNFPEYLKEDFAIRNYFGKKMKNTGIEKVEIERSPNRVNVIVYSSRPGLIIGRGGEGIETLKKSLIAVLRKIKPITGRKKPSNQKKEFRLEVLEVKDVWSSASLVGQIMAQEIEKRLPFRRVLKGALEKITAQKDVSGARVEVSGRLNGAEIARSEWLQKGRLPRQTLRSIIDYAQVEAFCTYGVIGIKVWIYKGQKLNY